MGTDRHHRHLLRGIVKVMLWTLMAVTLLILGTAICLVRLIKPETLTPLIEKVANRELDGDVSIGAVDLTFRGSFPFVGVQVDSLVITSRQIKALPPQQRATLPVWADTLLSIGRLQGGINIARAIAGEVEINDVDITRPRLSICVADSIGNYSIFRPDKDHSGSIDFPRIRLRRFRFVDPQPVRYADVASNVHAVAYLSVFDIRKSGTGRDGIPRYNVRFDSDIDYPLLQRLGMGSELPVSVDGTLEWNTERGSVLVLSDFRYTVGRLSGKIDSEFDFHDSFTLNALDFTLDPVAVDWMLRLVPDTVAARLTIPEIRTNARVGLRLTVQRPFTIGGSMLPHATLRVLMPDCQVHWRDVEIDRLALDATIQLRGLNLNAAEMRLSSLEVESPAGDLHLSGMLRHPLSNPGFSGSVRGTIDIDSLPSVCAAFIPAALSGTVKADASVEADVSMLSPERYPEIRASGDIDVSRLTWLSDDTLKMYHVDHLALRLGRRPYAAGADSTLCADIDIDRAEMLASNIAFTYSDVHLGVDTRRPAAGGGLVPLRARLKAGVFDLATLGSGAGMSVRGLQGVAAMKGTDSQERKGGKDAATPDSAAGSRPRFALDLTAARVSAGGRDTRLALDGCRLTATARGIRPRPALPEEYMEKRAMARAFGIKRAAPHIPIDSVYSLALEIHDRNHIPGHHRVHPASNSAGDEYIDFGATRVAWTLLNDWDIHGRFTAPDGRLVSPAVTLPNSVRNFNLAFSTDTATLTDVAWRVGRSDFLVSGAVSNMRLGFTSPGGRKHLRVHLDVFSDTIDIDQLADPDPAHTLAEAQTGIDKSDKPGKPAAGEDRAAQPSEHPVLIPANIDAEIDLRARHTIYSGLVMNDLSATALMCDGAVSLHDLQARSDVGAIDLSALYSAPSAGEINAGVGLKVTRFNIEDFLRLVPPVDSLMPMLHRFGGVVDVDIAATTRIRPDMDIDVPSMRVALTLHGDSLRVLDPEVYRYITRWLLLRSDESDMIPHVTAECTLRDGCLDLYPMIFDFNRYRLGVQGRYDIDSTFNYHVAVLRSPIPFRFGINITGRPHHVKVRFGGAHLDEGDVVSRRAIAPDSRISLMRQLDEVFRRESAGTSFMPLQIDTAATALHPTPLAEKDSIYLVTNQKSIDSNEKDSAQSRAD